MVHSKHIKEFRKNPDLGVYKMTHFVDDRGLFSTLEIPFGMEVVGINLSFSNSRVVRGLHYQKKFPQAKTIICAQGRGYDLALDLRRNSKTYGELYWEELIPGKSVFVPRGFAHGLISMDKLKVVYAVDSDYVKEDDTGVNVASLKEISEYAHFTRSERDKELPYFTHGDTYIDFNW